MNFPQICSRYPSLLLLLLLQLPIAVIASESGMVGHPRPDVELPDLAGAIHNLDEWRGKVLVINFWATWCAPCLREIPMFNAIQSRYGVDKVQFVGIAIDNTTAITKFLLATPVHYQVLVGGFEGAALAEDFGNEQGALPYTVFVDKQGIISAAALGGLTEKITRAHIDKLL